MGAGPDRLPAYPLMSLGTLKGWIMFKLEFATDSAAFDNGNREVEAARILREIIAKMEAGSEGGPVRDLNGNTIGRWEYPDNEPEPYDK